MIILHVTITLTVNNNDFLAPAWQHEIIRNYMTGDVPDTRSHDILAVKTQSKTSCDRT